MSTQSDNEGAGNHSNRRNTRSASGRRGSDASDHLSTAAAKKISHGVFGQGAPRGGLPRSPPGKASPRADQQAWDSTAGGSNLPFHRQSTPGDQLNVPVLTGGATGGMPVGISIPGGMSPIGDLNPSCNNRPTEEELEQMRADEINRRVQEAARQRQQEAEDGQARARGGEANNQGLAGFNSNGSPVMRDDAVADEEVQRIEAAAEALQGRQAPAEEQFGPRGQQRQRGEAAAEVGGRRQQQEVSENHWPGGTKQPNASGPSQGVIPRCAKRALPPAATTRSSSEVRTDSSPPLPPDPGYRPLTPSPEVYISKGQDVVDTFDDLYADMDLSLLSTEYLGRLSLEVEKQLSIINTVMEKLSLVENISREKQLFRGCRRNLGQLIKQVQQAIVSRQRVNPLPSHAAASGGSTPHPIEPTTVPDSSRVLRQNRVRAQEQTTVDEVDALVAEMGRMEKESPTSLRLIRNLEDRARGVKERVDNLGREVAGLLKDAIDSGMPREAESLAERQGLLNATYRELAGRLHEIKAASGVEGVTRAKAADLPPPTFAGGPTEDLFKFLDKFDDYIDSCGYSAKDNLRLMRETCLKGVVATACEYMETMGEIKLYLTDVYGQPRILFDAKVKEFTKLGKCPSAPAWKRRDWYVNVKNQIDYLTKICDKFDLMTDLHFSDVTQLVHAALPLRVYQDFLTSLGELSPSSRTRPRIFAETNKLLKEQLKQSTSDANIMLMLGVKDQNKGVEQAVKKATINYLEEDVIEFNDDDDYDDGDDDIKEVAVIASTQKPAKKNANKQGQPIVCVLNQKVGPPQEVSCVACNLKHTHSYLCSKYQEANLRGRSMHSKTQGSCKRCLRMDAGLDLSNREAWWKAHEPNCNGDWVCTEATCKNAPPHRQYHLTLCQRHPRGNKARQADFIATLDKKAIPEGLSFFYACMPTNMFPAQAGPELGDNNNAIFLLQDLYNQRGARLLLFYDSGCSGAALSDLAAACFSSKNIIPGPTFLNVAAGATLEVPGGTDEFELELYGDQSSFVLQGLHMPTVTTYMPEFQLVDAYKELQAAYLEAMGVDVAVTVPNSVGGKGVDVMIGIQYLYFFPHLLFTLPSGLSIYETKIKTLSGHRGVLGGPHSSWSHASTNTMSPRAFMSAELRAYQVQARVLHAPVMALVHEDDEDDTDRDLINEANLPLEPCCDIDEWVDTAGRPWQCFMVNDQPVQFEDGESMGAEVTYRCLRCRVCSDCLRGEFFEKQSLQEETEQAMLEAAVWFDSESRNLKCRLPFTKDPEIMLADNKQVATTIFESQMRTFTKNPAMKAAVVQAHNKLLDNGHVAAIDDLPEHVRLIVDQSPGSYHVPWSCVHKADSISTPYRVVFNASFKTRTGESLNSVLAKGANMLPRIFHLLIKFRARKFAFSADVSMAYNAVKLEPKFYTYQRYLWKPDLDINKPTTVMCIKTLIYGVRPSGGMTQAGFTKLADHAMIHTPELSPGAEVLKHNTYVDDTLASFNDFAECKEAARAMELILASAGIKVKEFTFSGLPPTEKVSTDGATVGALGYLWNSVEETVSLSIKPVALGKTKRSRKPVPEGVSFQEALSSSPFTKRALTSQVAGVFDPQGFATPVTARLKRDLAVVVGMKVDWDQALPPHLIPVWANNLDRIQQLKQHAYPRSFVHPAAVNDLVDLIVSVDASKDVAAATVHARSYLPDGSVCCRLVAAKSKLAHLSTVPRGELRAAVLGASLSREVISNIAHQVKSVIFVSDSMIALYWMKQDTRPLQTAVRNAVIEIRRLTQISSWYHISSANNVADIGTRDAGSEEIGPDTEWVQGRPWMTLPVEDYPIKSVDQLKLEQEELKAAMAEIKAPDICGINLPDYTDNLEKRYLFSKYLVDPCVMRWPKSVRILAYVYLFVDKTRGRLAARGPKPLTRSRAKAASATKPKESCPLKPSLEDRSETVQIPEEYLERAENYFFHKATLEVKQFAKKTDYQDCSTHDGKILKYTSRILDGQPIADEGEILGEAKSLHFARPIVDRYSPVAYSIMVYVHQDIACHENPVVVLRESRSLAFIIRGRDLANEIAEACISCRRFKLRMVQTEMGKQHPSTLTVAPAFFHAQIDLAGPWLAMCEHNCRSKVKVWALLFRCPATSAVAAYAMPACSTSAFLQAYTRHACRYGHPAKLFTDAGSGLLKACKEAKYSWAEVTSQINSKFGVGFSHEVCPPFGHNFHGAVERSVKELKKLFGRIFGGLRLQLLSYEAAFAYVANMLNNLPICLGSKVDNLGHRDILTPNRLIVGRNNLRAASSIPTVNDASRISEHLAEVERAWWAVWEKERITDYVPQPKKWRVGGSNIQNGDIVVFPMESDNSAIGEPTWRTGRVLELIPGRDGVLRRLKIEYQNDEEKVYRTVTRDTRHVAVVHRETDLELTERLNAAAKSANCAYLLLTDDERRGHRAENLKTEPFGE